jgi:hypothetical protein
VRSARDDIWIDMVQFDVRAADRLWEGIPPEHGAPGWYDDVSGLIETASGPAEPHELVDEAVVVEDMAQTTLGGPRRCRRGRTVGRLIAMKAAAATTASVVGVVAAAAATTGIVATVASVVVPVIEEHVLPADDDERESATPATPRPGDTGGSPDTRADAHPIDPAAAPPAADPAPPADAAPVDPVPADLPPGTDPAEDPPVGSGPIESASIESEPAGPPHAGHPPAVEPSPDGARHPAAAPPDHVRPDKGRSGGDEPVDADAHGHNSWPGRSHRGGRQAHHGDARAATAADPVEQAPAADSRRPG